MQHRINSFLALTAGAALALAYTSSVSAFSGDGTFYEPEKSDGGQVFCSNKLFTNNDKIAALAVGRSDNGCNKCARVTGPKGSVRVRIMDACASCQGDDIDLSISAFQKIADLDVGRLTVNWEFVSCGGGDNGASSRAELAQEAPSADNNAQGQAQEAAGSKKCKKGKAGKKCRKAKKAAQKAKKSRKQN